MKTNWNKSYDTIRVYEGGNVDDPHDPGGRTSRGVTQRVYDAFRQEAGLKLQDVYVASDDEIARIYKEQYWKPSRCDDLPSGIDLIVFDIAVNSGIKRAYKLLQAALNAHGHIGVIVDGTPGMVTLNACLQDDDHDMLIATIGERRLAFYKGLSTWPRFGKGWAKRNANCVKIAQAWATGSVGPSPLVTGTAKAKDEHIATSPIAPSTGTAIAGGATTGATGVEIVKDQLETAEAAVSSLAPYLDLAQYMLVALVFVGIGVTAYAIWKNYKAQKVRNAE